MDSMDASLALEALSNEGSADEIERAMMALVKERGAEKTICPSEVARAIAGSNEKEWRLLMRPVREQAIALARSGDVEIRRKGKRIDPETIRGVYRIALGPGNTHKD